MVVVDDDQLFMNRFAGFVNMGLVREDRSAAEKREQWLVVAQQHFSGRGRTEILLLGIVQIITVCSEVVGTIPG